MMEVQSLVAVDGATHLKLLIEILKRSFLFFVCTIFWYFIFLLLGFLVCFSLAFSTIIYVEIFAVK